MKHLNKWWLYLYDFSMAVNQNIGEKETYKSLFILNSYDFYALVSKGLKWLTVSVTLVDRINSLGKQIDAPVGFGCKLYIRKHSE